MPAGTLCHVLCRFQEQGVDKLANANYNAVDRLAMANYNVVRKRRRAL